MASLIHPLAISGSRKADGTVNAGGLVFLTQPGTSTAVTGYADRDKLSALATVGGGILLDSAGKAAIFIEQTCTVRVTDPNGLAVDTFVMDASTNAGVVEVISPGFTGLDANGSAVNKRTFLATVLASIATSCGGPDGLYTSAQGSPTSPMKLQTVIDGFGLNVKNFGAIGNGTADDTTAIQNAINAAAGAGGGIVYFPPGTYITSSALSITAPGVDLVGAGSTVTAINLTNASGINAINVSPSSTGGVFSNRIATLQIAGSSTTGTAVAVTGSAGILLDRVYISGNTFRTALSIASTGALNAVDNCNLTVNTGDASSVAILSTSTKVVYVANSNTSGGATSGISQNATAGRLLVSSVTMAAVGGDGITIAGTSDAVIADVIFTSLATNNGINVTSSGNVNVVASRIQSASHAITLGASATNFFESANVMVGDVSDGRTGSPVTFNIGSSTAVTPLPGQTEQTAILGTAGGITVTVNSPGASYHGKKHTIIFSNTSGGAVTWSLNAVYVTSANPAPATGNRVAIIFEYDAPRAKWYEVGRAATAN